MATSTNRLSLRKPNPDPLTGDVVDAEQDLNENWDKIDEAIGAEPVTEATKDAVIKYDGKLVRTTENRLVYVWNATQSAWDQVTLAGSTNINKASVNVNRATATDAAFTGNFGADSQKRIIVQADGTILLGSGSAIGDTNLYRSAADKLATDDDFLVNVAGKGLRVKEGSNAKMGTATLTGITTVTVANTSVTATSRIFLTIQAPAGTVGTPYVFTRTAGTSFGIRSTNSADTSTVAWMIVEPA